MSLDLTKLFAYQLAGAELETGQVAKTAQRSSNTDAAQSVRRQKRDSTKLHSRVVPADCSTAHEERQWCSKYLYDLPLH